MTREEALVLAHEVNSTPGYRATINIDWGSGKPVHLVLVRDTVHQVEAYQYEPTGWQEKLAEKRQQGGK